MHIKTALTWMHCFYIQCCSSFSKPKYIHTFKKALNVSHNYQIEHNKQDFTTLDTLKQIWLVNVHSLVTVDPLLHSFKFIFIAHKCSKKTQVLMYLLVKPDNVCSCSFAHFFYVYFHSGSLKVSQSKYSGMCEEVWGGQMQTRYSNEAKYQFV